MNASEPVSSMTSSAGVGFMSGASVLSMFNTRFVTPAVSRSVTMTSTGGGGLMISGRLGIVLTIPALKFTAFEKKALDPCTNKVPGPSAAEKAFPPATLPFASRNVKVSMPVYVLIVIGSSMTITDLADSSYTTVWFTVTSTIVRLSSLRITPVFTPCTFSVNLC